MGCAVVFLLFLSLSWGWGFALFWDDLGLLGLVHIHVPSNLCFCFVRESYIRQSPPSSHFVSSLPFSLQFQVVMLTKSVCILWFLPILDISPSAHMPAVHLKCPLSSNFPPSSSSSSSSSSSPSHTQMDIILIKTPM